MKTIKHNIMKKIKKKPVILTLLFSLTLIMFSCVDDEFDTPPPRTIPEGDPITIQEVKDLFDAEGDYVFTTDKSIYAVVTMDDKSGNIYRTAYIQDETGAIALHMEASGGLYQGDSLRLQLNGLKVGQYNNLFQIDAPDGNGFTMDDYVTKLDTKVEVTPESVSIIDISQNMDYYQGRLIKLDNVQFVASDTSKTYADSVNQITKNRTLEDVNGDEIIVRTSGYASFANDSIPNGSGSIVAILGQYGNTLQLYIRSTEEVEMDNERLSGGSAGDAQGTGTFEDPYNAAAGIVNQGENNVWVEGFIVGVYETSGSDFTPSFEGPYSTNSNLIIADSETETSIANCVIVQLPIGEIRSALNLVENPGNEDKSVKVYGNLTTYFNEAGLKNPTGYWIDGSGSIPESGFFEEDFASDLGTFTTFNVNGAQVWEWADYDNGSAYMSGYDGASVPNEDWLVSPSIDLTGKTNVTMVIREAINDVGGTYASSADIYNNVQILVSTDYDGTSDPSTQGTWNELTGISRPAGDSWTFESSGDIDLSTYDGESAFYIAFKYVSSDTQNVAWEVGNVLLKEASK